MEKKKNEELQSRREFFKKAAKGALPILAAVVLAGAPSIMKATEVSMGCNSGCTTHCDGTCKGTCEACKHGCSNSCMSGCTNGCKRTSTKN